MFRERCLRPRHGHTRSCICLHHWSTCESRLLFSDINYNQTDRHRERTVVDSKSVTFDTIVCCKSHIPFICHIIMYHTHYIVTLMSHITVCFEPSDQDVLRFLSAFLLRSTFTWLIRFFLVSERRTDLDRSRSVSICQERNKEGTIGEKWQRKGLDTKMQV